MALKEYALMPRILLSIGRFHRSLQNVSPGLYCPIEGDGGRLVLQGVSVNPRWPGSSPQWYLGVRCQKCHIPILFAVDHSDRSEDTQTRRAGTLVLTCTVDACRHKADYTNAVVLRLQK